MVRRITGLVPSSVPHYLSVLKNMKPSDSLINIKPALNNSSRLIEDEDVIKTATEIIESWIKR